MDKRLRGPALSEAIRDYVKKYIIQNRLRPGDPLPPETQLMEELGVGRSSVREAVKALQSLGIVEIRRGNGSYVRQTNFDAILEVLNFSMQFDPHMFAEMFRIRVWLESGVIGEAVAHITPEDIANLEDVMQTWKERVTTGEAYADLDELFHCILYRSLNNHTLIMLLDVFWTAFKQVDIDRIREADPQVAWQDHRDLLDVIKTGEPQAARRRLLEHFQYVQQRIANAIETTVDS